MLSRGLSRSLTSKKSSTSRRSAIASGLRFMMMGYVDELGIDVAAC